MKFINIFFLHTHHIVQMSASYILSDYDLIYKSWVKHVHMW